MGTKYHFKSQLRQFDTCFCVLLGLYIELKARFYVLGRDSKQLNLCIWKDRETDSTVIQPENRLFFLKGRIFVLLEVHRKVGFKVYLELHFAVFNSTFNFPNISNLWAKLKWALKLSFAKLWYQIPSLDHLVIWNSVDFPCWKLR